MSEEVDIKTKNFTTTEDEFEDFQANSIYAEEEDFITLSDLVSPQHEVTEAVLENSDISENLPYEQHVYEDVGLSSECISIAAENDFDRTPLQDRNSKHHLSAEDSNVRPSFDPNYAMPQLKTKGRGRKSKSQFTVKSKTELTKPLINTKRGHGRGRGGLRGRSGGGLPGRGKKQSIETLLETVQSPSSSNNESLMEKQTCVTHKKSKKGKKGKNLEKSERAASLDNANDVTSTMNDLSNCGKRTKRGRPKKNIETMTTNQVTKSKNCDNLPKIDIKKPKSKKRGRKTKSKLSTFEKNDNISEKKFASEDFTDYTSITHKHLINDSNKIDLQNNYIDSSSIAVANEESAEINDDGDNICLSKLKSQLENVVSHIQTDNTHSENELHTKESDTNILTENFTNKQLLGNAENKIVAVHNAEIIESDQMEIDNLTSSPVIIDSKRPIRNRNKPLFKYDELGSEEEDPFANIELSDDEPNKKKKGKYNYDYEYVPGKRKTKNSSDSDDFDNDDEGRCRKRKIYMFDKNGKIRSTKKKRRQKLSDVKENKIDCSDTLDIEDSLKSSVVLKRSQDNITDFLAKKIQGTDIKICKAKPTLTSQTTFEIPVIDPNEPKKCVETSTQTNSINIKSAGVQTGTQYERGMMKQVTLSSVQAEKACDFLKNIVSTTAELGELMTQKSQEFIEKKINMNHITDTLKMDYCVKKSFLLFKLAKQNLLQMEEDLEEQYEEFLKSNNLLQYREQKKEITPQLREDSDCEIVEVPDPVTKTNSKAKAVFNPKTVFLNKELSIKIAKKAQEQPTKQKEKINVKGKHTVWINDSIMVKKVKTTQSFLAQDSRNKKPPDYITLEMVKRFFDEYTKQRMLLICKKFNSVEWLSSYQEVIVNYFIKDSNNFESTKITENVHAPASNCQITNHDISGFSKSDILIKTRIKNVNNPKTLFTLCIQSFQNQYKCVETFQMPSKIFIPKSLFTLCIESFQKQSYNPKSLVTTCTEVIQNQTVYGITNSVNKMNTSCVQQADSVAAYIQNKEMTSLKFLCLVKLNKLMINYQQSNDEYIDSKHVVIEDRSAKHKINCLSTLCFMKIQEHYLPHNICNSVNSLSRMTLQVINQLLSNQLVTNYGQSIITRQLERAKDLIVNINEPVVMIGNNVNTHGTDADLSLFKKHCWDKPQQFNEVGDYEKYSDDYFDYNSESNCAAQATEESSWVSQVLLQDLHSGAQSSPQSGEQEDTNIMYNVSNVCTLKQIKIEPIHVLETTTAFETVKMEPVDVTDNNESFIPSTSFFTKEEYIDHISDEKGPRAMKGSLKSFDVDLFESFVQSRNTIKDLNTSYLMSKNDEIYSQSSQRIRRQYEPDSDEENINSVDSMGLLVPHSIEQAKDSLLENSSDDGEKQMDKAVKKRSIRFKSGKKITKELSSTKEKQLIGKEVEIFARKMRGRIRLEEKRQVNSGSDSDTPLITRKKRQSELPETNGNNGESENITKPSSNEKLISGQEIQCNDVDSTECITQDMSQKSWRTKKWHSNCDNIQENSLNYDLEVPSELLECEPDISIGYKNICSEKGKDTNKNECESTSQKNLEDDMMNEPKYVDRNGWKCYEINRNDSKLYEEVSIALEKLPESFVTTYNTFLGINEKSNDDTEVDRLINLNSLHRNLSKEKDRGTIKERKGFKKSNKVSTEQERNDKNDEIEHFAELTPSEDENEDTEDTGASEVHNIDNNLAKNLLLGDNESDSDQPSKSFGRIEVKQEPGTSKETEIYSNPKNKVTKTADGSDVMLTADIMMNKELALLHAPVALKEEVAPTDSKDIEKCRNSLRAGVKKPRPIAGKDDDDSSSEEEKQWVNTKEKMLKRMEKKQDVTNEDEAKGAKRVSEFIEKCGDGSEIRPRTVRVRGKRSRKKLLEKRKQMKILAKELLVESGSGKRSSQTYGKGRRNIRKVIDKKSLQRDTVRANMQEFERKQRLAHRLVELRERLGCEEGVNVVVINGELCLQYDFEKNAPVASVHPYFTGVMKAHQYEGVKFMWDACFETVERVSGGHPGSGCILAHCMGLGKTLQVLALLHTVLTHPRLNMRRVLVCCPLSTVLNWVDEIHKWIGPVTNQIKVFELSKLKKTYERAYQLEDWSSGGGIFIIGYELFRSLSTLDADVDEVRPTIIRKIRTALLDPGPDVVICDEGHLLKNDSSVLAVAMSRVSTNRRIVLTGTPMQNNLREYYCMVNFVKPHLLGTYYEFSNRFENPIMNGQHRDSIEEDIKLMKTRTHILHKVLEGCLQRQEASVLYPYLPKKYEYTVFVPLTESQRRMYKHYLESYAKRGRQMVLKDFHTLQKIWTHPQVLHNFQTKWKAREEENKNIKAEKLEDDLAHEDITASEDAKPAPTEVWWLQYLEGGDMLGSLHSSNKFQVIFNLLDECVALGDKALIFSTSLFTMDTLEYFLRSINKWSLGRDYYRLDGSVPAEVRQKWCREFNAPQNHRTKLFLISTRAGSLGLNMTAANRVIILDTSWNPAHDIQSIFRVYRFGQKKDCFIYRLVAMGTMEQKIYERSVTKQAVSCRVVDEQQIDRHYNSAELTELYSWDEEGWGVLAGMAPGVRDPALLRVAAAGAVHAVREHDSLLRGSEPALPEDERAAAWQQFQLEHAEGHRAHVVTAAKQMDEANRRVDAKPPAGAVEALASTEPSASSEAKRGERRATAADAPDRPEEDADAENDLVKKIMKILISHKFHETAAPEEVTALVENIKRLVTCGTSDFSADDAVAASIASVLLRDKHSNSASAPPEVAEGSGVRPDSSSERSKRATRKAALKAERSFVAIDVEPRGHAGDVEWDAGGRGRKSKSKRNEREVPPDATPSGDRSVACSIVISDDEVEGAPVSKPEKKKGVKSYSRRNRGKSKESSKRSDENRAAEEADEAAEAVPLHASLLADDNFVKIVAHTYLKGNPTLAEDAALMAAHYSTGKALEELQSSGRPITGGPIYDIAVKILGKTLLKKMNQKCDASSASASAGDERAEARPRAPKPAVPASPPPSDAHVVTDDDDDLQIVVAKEAIPKKPFVGPKSRKLQMERRQARAKSAVERPTSPRPAANDVFPVGMFIGPGTPAENSSRVREERILPDDDDDVIVAPICRPSPIPIPSPVRPASREPSVSRSSRRTTAQGSARRPPPNVRISYPKLLPKPQITSVPNSLSTRTTSAKRAPTICTRVPNESIASTAPRVCEAVEKEISGGLRATAGVAPASEPICLSDSDDEPSVDPGGSAEVPVSADGATPTPAPLLLRTASFKANSPFVLPPAIKKMLDPTKKYYCIPSSSLPFLQSQNIVLNDALIPGVNANSVSGANTHSLPGLSTQVPVETDVPPTENSSPSIAIGGAEQLQVRGRLSTTVSTDPQPLPNATEIAYNKRLSKSSTSRSLSDVVKMNHRGESKVVPAKSNNEPGTVSARRLESNRNKNTAPAMLSDIEILDDDPRPTKGTNTKHSINTTRSRIPPEDDPMSIFKNVVHIQAPQSDITEAERTVEKTVRGNSSMKSKINPLGRDTANPFTKVTTTFGSRKPTVSVTLDLTDSDTSESDKKRHKLELLKRLEKAKFATAKFKTNIDTTPTSSSSSRPDLGGGAGRRTNKKAAISTVDLTALPGPATNPPNVDSKRPSPWSKRDTKKPKRLQTLEDFDLDDIDDITELE